MTDDVLFSTDRNVGRIRLNRPKAIHALTREMCDAMSEALLAWREDPSIQVVVIDHAEGRGFCAGGDVVMLARSGADDAERRQAPSSSANIASTTCSSPTPSRPSRSWTASPWAAASASRCHATIASRPRTPASPCPRPGIGLFPDVGGGWYLSRLPGRVGQFMALTGARLDGGECLYLGLATQLRRAVVARRAARADPQGARPNCRVHSALPRQSPPEARIEATCGQITELFASDRLEDILAALEADGSDWAQTELATLKSKSPLSCKVSLRLLAEGANRASFADEMRAEYALAGRIVRTHDFREGVRALLVDKDNNPQWDPPTPEGVDRRDARRLVRAASRARGMDPVSGDPRMTEYNTILVEQRGAVTLVTLNRPQALNALNSEVLKELIDAFAAYDADDSQRCLVLTGSEKAFAAGADIKEMQSQGFADMYSANFFGGWEQVTSTRKPWIAAVAGYALGGGCEVAMMADFIIAADTAKFGQPEIKLGVTPGHGRVAAAGPRGRQGQGDGDVPDRPDDGRRGSRALRPRRPRRSGRRIPRRGA